ncbi:hypothetical protein OF83DRAFT_1066962 [Amylostereum chailletii]|nr:hypothetical protein OF83DRAFT_1066962 [Amylostereum chailletii]
MHFNVARLRLAAAAAALSLFPAARAAHLNTLFTSSVSYCAPPENILVQQFDVAYFPSNNSVVFNISAASVQSNVNVSANLYLNVYGIQPVNLTIDICNLLDGALCPLPIYDFVGSESLALPDGFDISFIPGIAYKIPDLEAFAQLTLRDVETGDLKACIQSTLANGWSTRQIGVSWATAGIAFLSLASAAWQSFIPDTVAPFRLLDLFALYQSIASSGFLNLNYPVVYRSYVLNFAWAIGLFAQPATSSIQLSIDRMRNITGGHLENLGVGGATALVNRKQSPYNEPADGSGVPAARRALSTLLSTTDGHGPLAARDVQTVTTSSDNVLQAGVPVFSNSIGIATGNVFMTAFFTALILSAIALGILAIVYAIVLIVSCRRGRYQAWWSQTKDRYPQFASAWGLRVALVCLFPLIVFPFYQWTQKDSWLADFIAAITFVGILGGVGYSAYRVLFVARRSSPFVLYEDLPALAPLYDEYRTPRYYFFVVPLASIFIRSIFIAFAKDSSMAQVILMTIAEFFHFLALCVLRPGKRRRADVLSIYLAVTRLVCTGLLIAFTESINLLPIPRVAIGIVTAVIYSVAVVITFFNTVWNIGLHYLWRRRAFIKLPQRTNSFNSALMEKKVDRGLDSDRTSLSGSQDGRQNPTPTQHTPLDPAVNQPYPAFTPTTTMAEPPSATTQSSYGQQVESKWRSPSRLSDAYVTPPESAHFHTSPPVPHRFSHHRVPPPAVDDEFSP